MWKVYNIQTDEIIKADFNSEASAREWLDSSSYASNEEVMVEEMDPDEEAEWADEGDEPVDTKDDMSFPEEEETRSYKKDRTLSRETFEDEYYDGTDLEEDFDALVYETDDDDE
ncbi:MAG: hypothetical protein HQK54_05680 [Oligoflexales bacterium]|nr:hypothetical protein [Oligoflexales bacterium]